MRQDVIRRTRCSAPGCTSVTEAHRADYTASVEVWYPADWALVTLPDYASPEAFCSWGCLARFATQQQAKEPRRLDYAAEADDDPGPGEDATALAPYEAAAEADRP